MLDTARETPDGNESPVPAPANVVSQTAPSGPVASTVDCCPFSASFASMSGANRPTYGFDALSNEPANAGELYWVKPNVNIAVPANKETLDGAAWVSVPKGGETTVVMSLLGCSSADNLTYEVVPTGVASVVEPKPSTAIGELTIRGDGEGEASLKVMCRGKVVGYFHIWCREMATIMVGVGVIKVTSAIHNDLRNGQPLATARTIVTAGNIADIKVALDKFYRQALIEFDVRPLGTFDADAAPDGIKHSVQELVFDGPSAIFDHKGMVNNRILTTNEGAARWQASLNVVGQLAARQQGNYGTRSIWFMGQPDQVAVDISGAASGIPGQHLFMFLPWHYPLETIAHELGHLLGLAHPIDLEEFNGEQLPSHLRSETQFRAHEWFHYRDPNNLMGNNLPNNEELRYRQWKALPRS